MTARADTSAATRGANEDEDFENSMKTIYLIRHGESVNNKLYGHIIGGIARDVELTLLGEMQADAVGKRLVDDCILPDRIYASTAIRARDTAYIAAKRRGFPLEKIVLTDEILEMDRGEYAGKIRKDIYTQEMLEIINQDPWNHKPPGGESQRDVEVRMMNFVKKNIINDYDDSVKDERVAIFGHGYAFKCLVRGIIDSNPGMTFKIEIENASITEFNYDSKGWHLIRLNDAAHSRDLEYMFDK